MLIKKLSEQYDSIELQKVVTSTLEFFVKEKFCTQAMWFCEETLKKFVRNDWQIFPNALWLGADEKAAWQTFPECLADDVRELIYQMSQHLPASWSRISKPTLLSTPKNNFIVLPVEESSKSWIGCLMLVLRPKQSARPIIKKLQTLSPMIRRQFGWSAELQYAKALAFQDDLTQLYNQRYLPIILDREVSHAVRQHSSFSVLFLDIDYLKMVNDTKGHLVGSRLISEVGHIIRQNIRTSDFGFRYGGDEFVIVLPDLNCEAARFVAERIRRQVENKVVEVSGFTIKFTVSIGIASCPEHAKTPDQVLKLADRAMYMAKNKNRNSVYLAAA